MEYGLSSKSLAELASLAAMADRVGAEAIAARIRRHMDEGRPQRIARAA